MLDQDNLMVDPDEPPRQVYRGWPAIVLILALLAWSAMIAATSAAITTGSYLMAACLSETLNKE